MKPKQREKILAAVAGGLLVAGGIGFLFVSGDSRSVPRLIEERKSKEAEIEKQQAVLDAAHRDAKQLAAWRRLALPSNTVVARSLYQNWLLGLAERAHFRQLRIESRETGSKNNVDTHIAFALHGRTNLADLTTFLHEFYSAGHLQQIRRLEIKPQENTRELDITLAIEALSLPDADRKDQLSKEPGRPLRLAKLEDYRDSIAKRDLFTADMKQDKSIDPAEFTFVTGFTEVNGVRQVWLWNRIADQKWLLKEHEEFQVDHVRGTVQSITATREVTVDFDGRRRRLRSGENLRQGVVVEEPAMTAEKNPPPVASDHETAPPPEGKDESTSETKSETHSE